MARMKSNVDTMPAPELEFLAPRLERSEEVLIPAVSKLVVTLHRKFNGRRLMARVQSGAFPAAMHLFSSMVKNDSFDEFLTLPAYELLP